MSRSLRPVVLLLFAVGVVSIVSACRPRPGTDNDRPPIIISDGSVRLRAVAKDRGNGTNNDRGTWTQSGSKWNHDHGGPTFKNMAVNVINGSGGANCSSPTHDFVDREFVVTYVAGASDATFKVFVDAPNASAAGKLGVDGAAAAIDLGVPFWLRIGAAGDKLKAVKFTNLNVTCNLANSEIHVYQSTKH